MFKHITAVLSDERGQGLAEYGLILGLIAVVCIGALTTMGQGINSALQNVAADV
jgi:pilus assembly protein Flp/PilA